LIPLRRGSSGRMRVSISARCSLYCVEMVHKRKRMRPVTKQTEGQRPTIETTMPKGKFSKPPPCASRELRCRVRLNPMCVCKKLRCDLRRRLVIVPRLRKALSGKGPNLRRRLLTIDPFPVERAKLCYWGPLAGHWMPCIHSREPAKRWCVPESSTRDRTRTRTNDAIPHVNRGSRGRFPASAVSGSAQS
jgi:hypothetical protein